MLMKSESMMGTIKEWAAMTPASITTTAATIRTVEVFEFFMILSECYSRQQNSPICILIKMYNSDSVNSITVYPGNGESNVDTE